MRKLLILLYLLIFIQQTYAQTITWQAQKKKLEIGNKVQILEDKSGELTFEKVASGEYDSLFFTSPKVHLGLGYTESMFWIKFTFDNPTQEQLCLELGEAGLPIVELYYIDGNGKTVIKKAGYQIPMDQKLVKSSFQVFPLPQGKHDYYVRFNHNSQPIPVNIHEIAAYDLKSNTEKLIYGFYMGLMCFVFLSNLFFFYSLRIKMHLYYALIVVLYASYSFAVVDGFMVYFFRDVDMLFWYTTIPSIGVTVQLIYCLFFLEVSKYTPKLYKFTVGVVIYFALWAFLKFGFGFHIVQPINTLNALISFFLMGFIGIRVGKAGNKMGYYFALAYFIYFLMVLVEATYINTGSPPKLGGLSHTAYGTLIEAFVLSFLLSKRIEWEKEEIENEKANAQMQLLAKTLENEKIVRNQNVILEQKVEERTSQLKESNDNLNVMLVNLEKEKQKSEDLLHNILPEEIAEELKNDGHSAARLFEHVSVLFTDFVNFTGISENVSPEVLVAEIDLCYKAFDAIIEKNNLEKIKTIGDAYLAVSGLPVESDKHAINAVSAALEINEFVEKRKENGGLFQLRAGINSGNVVAGIVGVKKFAYDIWGDTVNTAHRMESNSITGRVNISGATYELVKDHFKCEHRGKMEAKHKGMIDMYFVDWK